MSISRLFNISALITIFLAVFTVGLFWIYEEYKRAVRELSAIDNYYIEEQKKIIKQQVLFTVNYIEYLRRNLQDKARQDIKERVYEAVTLANSLYDTYKATKSPSEIEQMIKVALRYKRFFGDRGYYFATNLDGTEELFADRPELEGKNLLQSEDPHIRKVIAGMINLVKAKGEGYYEYRWTKPGKKGFQYPKVAYIKYFAPFNWFIGTGEYLDDLEQDMKQQILNWTSTLKTDLGNYIFIFDDQGTCLVHPDKNLIGKKFIGLKDRKGILVLKDIVEVLKKTNGDFFSYQFKKPGSEREFEKISFVYYYEKWGWIIGAGFYTDTEEGLIEQTKAESKRRIVRHFLIIVLIILVFFALVIIVNRVFAYRLKKDLYVFKNFFGSKSDITEPISVDKIRYQELKELCMTINSMIDRRNAIELDLVHTRQDYKALFDNMIEGFAIHEMIFDKDGNPYDYRFLTVNNAFERLTGLKAEDVVGKTVREVLPEIEDYWIETYGKVVTTGEPMHFDNYNVSLDRYFEVTAYRYKENQFACIFIDVTERVTMYKNLEELTKNLEERVQEELQKSRKQEAMLLQQSKLASMGEMLISISHHWRQPLNAIGLIVQSLEDYYDAQQLDRERIEWVKNAVMDRLNSLSETINAFSNYYQTANISDTFELSKAISNTIKLVSEDMLANDINIKFICPLSEPNHPLDPSPKTYSLFVRGDINQFNQVMLALITNSKEAILEQRRTSVEHSMKSGYVRISLKSTESDAIMKIEDNGGGISEEVMDRIFEPFFTTKEKSYTFGLGLYMSKLIIEDQMKGTIEVANTEEGAIFTITIPLHRESFDETLETP